MPKKKVQTRRMRKAAEAKAAGIVIEALIRAYVPPVVSIVSGTVSSELLAGTPYEAFVDDARD